MRDGSKKPAKRNVKGAALLARARELCAEVEALADALSRRADAVMTTHEPRARAAMCSGLVARAPDGAHHLARAVHCFRMVGVVGEHVWGSPPTSVSEVVRFTTPQERAEWEAQTSLLEVEPEHYVGDVTAGVVAAMRVLAALADEITAADAGNAALARRRAA